MAIFKLLSEEDIKKYSTDDEYAVLYEASKKEKPEDEKTADHKTNH